jgi:hypothetical protein
MLQKANQFFNRPNVRADSGFHRFWPERFAMHHDDTIPKRREEL